MNAPPAGRWLVKGVHMVVLGLILVVIAVAAAVVLIFENTDTVTIHAFGGQWTADSFWLAVIGAIVLVVAVLGLELMRSGSKRSLRHRSERRQLQRENAALSQQVASAPNRHATAAADDQSMRDVPPGERPPTR